MKKILITGGNGYIGARLSLFFANKGFQVIPVCFPAAPNNEEWKNKMFDIVVGDIRQIETIVEISHFKPDVIIHLVSLDHFNSENEPGLVNDVNVLPTWRLLDACSKNGLKKFIYFSTIQVYGKLPNSVIDEKYPVNSANIYGLTHHLSEQICDHYNRKTDVNVISIRLSNSYGAPIFDDNNCWWLVINDLCKNAYLNKKIQLLSDGSPQRDFIHGNDVCQAIEKLIDIENKQLENNIYHISAGETLTILEIAKIVRKVYQNRYNQYLPIILKDEVFSDQDPMQILEKYHISNAKIKEIGFSPLFDLETGINDLFAYLEDHKVS